LIDEFTPSNVSPAELKKLSFAAQIIHSFGKNQTWESVFSALS
jgi:hypothetical protein